MHRCTRCRMEALILLALFIVKPIHGFVFSSFLKARMKKKRQQQSSYSRFHFSVTITSPLGSSSDQNPFEDGQVGIGKNWIEAADKESSSPSPSSSSPESTKESIKNYNLGISGVSFKTGPLSKRIFDAISSGTPIDNMTDEVKRAFALSTMDFTAKEAVRGILKQNGLELALKEEDQEDLGKWGDIYSIRLLDPATNEPNIAYDSIYDSFEDAIEYWTPGQGFDFAVRQIPAKMKELTISELLQALDPDGAFREQAKSANMTLPDEGGYYDYDDISSLQDLINDCAKRTNDSPRGATSEEEAFPGLDSRGYRIINRSDLVYDDSEDGLVRHETLMHVMDALVSHGALIVDMTDGGKDYSTAKDIASMWRASEDFFKTLNSDYGDEIARKLPGMTTVAETGSQCAKVGYANYDNDSLQFLETRLDRSNGQLLPVEAKSVLGSDGVHALQSAFHATAQCGKDIIRISVAASSVESGAFRDDDDDDNNETLLPSAALAKASMAAALMATELVDDGNSLEGTSAIENSEGPVSMSPHRLCRYTNFNMQNEDDAREVFGAHTDASFITAVPAAAINGLEVYDEAEERWYRPELRARKHWQQQREACGEDPNTLVETLASGQNNEDGGKELDHLPWHARYVIFMPGELLQLTTRNEVPAAVHRVVATVNSSSRISAPILLRCRPGVKMNVDRYLGGTCRHPLLEECDGMSVEKIHDAMQPITK